MMFKKSMKSLAMCFMAITSTLWAAIPVEFVNGIDGYDGCEVATIGAGGWNQPTRLRIGANYQSGSEVFNTLIKFDNLDVIGSGNILKSAKIGLTFQYENIVWNEAVIDIAPLLVDWKKPTWAAAAAGQAWGNPGASGQADRGEVVSTVSMGPRYMKTFFNRLNYQDELTFYFDIPVTLVESWIAHPESNHGVIMTMNPAFHSDATFSSNGDTQSDFWPRLIVEYCKSIEGDINGDCNVDIGDIVKLAQQWIDDTSNYDMQTFGVISANWQLSSDTPAVE